MIKLGKTDRCLLGHGWSFGIVLVCRGAPPWAPPHYINRAKGGAPTEGRPYKPGRWSFLLLMLIFLSPFDRIARADGGVVMCQRTSAAFTITLFSTETPLRPGPADLSVLLEQPDGRSPILDAQVFIELKHEAGMIIRAEATRSQARNKLLYCSLINLPAAGHWKIRLHISRGNTRAEMLSDLVVAAPQPVFLSHWELIAVPPITIILFILNQWLRRRAFNERGVSL